MSAEPPEENFSGGFFLPEKDVDVAAGFSLRYMASLIDQMEETCTWQDNGYLMRLKILRGN